MTRHFDPPSPPVVGGVPNMHSGTNNKPVHRIVIHSAVAACVAGAARGLGGLNQRSTTGSWHYATDPAETIQCSFDSYVCWHAPPNLHSLGIEMADFPVPWPEDRSRRAMAKMRRVWRWMGQNHRLMLHRTAKLTAELALAYDVPIRFVSVQGLKDGKHGITTHVNVSKAFHQSTHWDPGAWPKRYFMRLVRRYAADIRDS